MDEPLEVVHLIGGARFTKLVMWLEDAAQWYVDEDGAEGYYTDVQLAYQTEIRSAIEQGALYAEWESKTSMTYERA